MALIKREVMVRSRMEKKRDKIMDIFSRLSQQGLQTDLKYMCERGKQVIIFTLAAKNAEMLWMKMRRNSNLEDIAWI